MTKVSRRPISPKVEEKLVRDFLSSLNGLSDQNRALFLEKVLTPAEKVMLAKRLVILKELARGNSYGEIQGKYNVISATIARMSNLIRSSRELLPLLFKLDPSIKKSWEVRSGKRSYGSRTVPGARRLLGL